MIMYLVAMMSFYVLWLILLRGETIANESKYHIWDSYIDDMDKAIASKGMLEFCVISRSLDIWKQAYGLN